MSSPNTETPPPMLSPDELSCLIIETDLAYPIARAFASKPTSTAVLRNYAFLSRSIDRLKLDLERHRLEQQALFTYLMESRTFQTKIQPIVHQYRRRNGHTRYRYHPYDRTPSPADSIDPPHNINDLSQETNQFLHRHSGGSSLGSYCTTIDETLGSKWNPIVVDHDHRQVEGSRENPIVISNKEKKERCEECGEEHGFIEFEEVEMMQQYFSQ